MSIASRRASILLLGTFFAACGGGYQCPGPGGSLTISSSADWANFAQAGCATVDGQLLISAPDLTSLTPPATALTSVGSLDVEQNYKMTTLELPALTTLTGDLTVVLNAALTRVSFPKLAKAGGTFLVQWNDADPTLDFSSLQSVGGYFALSNVLGSPVEFPALQSVGRDLFLGDGSPQTALSVEFPALSSIAGTLDARSVLTHLGLPALASAGAVDVEDNPALLELNFPNLTTVTRYVWIQNNALIEEIDAPLLATIPQDLVIAADDQLQTLSLPALTSVGSGLLIFSTLLRQCIVDGIAAQLTAPRPILVTDGNLGAPNTCP
jgi:hypothetical protein